MPPRDLSGILGFPNLTPAPRPPRLQPSPKLRPTPQDRNRARELLVHLRTSDPSYKAPDESKRRHFRSERKNKVLADTGQWTFSSYEVAKGVANYFSHETLTPGGVLAALLETASDSDGNDVDNIWKRSQGPPPESFRLRKPKPSDVGPCPWISLAADQSAGDALACLLEAGGSQKDLGAALEAALDRKDYAVARELVAFDAPFPPRPDLFSAATSQPLDMDFVNLWLAAPASPPPEFSTLAIATMMRMSSRESRTVLSMLLTSYPPSAAESAALLLQAIELGNLETLATVSAALHHSWPALGDIHHSEPCVRAATRIQHADARQRVLSFLFAAGVEPNLPDLRALLLKEVKAENVEHIRLLVSHGVPSHVRGGQPPFSPLEAAVETSHVDILRLVVASGTVIPSDVASAATERISDGWSEQTRAEMLDLLAPHVQEPKDSLSKLLLRAVRNSNQTVISTILRHGARSSYVDVGGANSLHIAVERGDVDLIQKLCAATPTASIASRALVAAYEAFGSGPTEPMLSVTSLLVREAATGDPADLSRMLTAGLVMQPRTVRRKVCAIIIAASTSSIGEGEALADIVREADADLELVRLLLRKSPSTAMLSDGLKMGLAAQGGAARRELCRLLFQASSPGQIRERQRLAALVAESVLDLELIRSFLSRIRKDKAARSATLKAALSRRSRADRMALCELVLGDSASEIGQSKALVTLVEEPDSDMALIDLLVRKGASVDHDQGRALVKAIERGSVHLLKALLGDLRIKPRTISRGFKTAMALPPGSPRTELTALLLSAGVSLDDRAAHLLSAVQSRDLPLLESLLAVGGPVPPLAEDALSYAVTHAYVQDVAAMVRQGIPEPLLVSVFQSLARTGHLGSPQYIETAALLMNLRVPHRILTPTLLTVCSETATALPVEFISLLISHGADPMAEDARCIVAAAKKHHIACAERLMTAPSFRLDEAVRALISSIHDEEWLVRWVSLCLQRSGARFLQHTLLRLALERFPSGATILRQLLDNGCEPMMKCSCKNEIGDDTTLLMWALAKDGRASEEVVLDLLDHPLAAPHFIHPADGLTAMHLAAGLGRLSVLRKLVGLQGEFHLQLPDSVGRTPLCRATEAGNAGAIAALMAAGAKVDDGSLHIAARSLDIASIKLLRSHGHDIHYPHAGLDGRRPLAELCFKASGSGPSWEFQAEAAIRELLPLPDPQWRPVHDKSFLHLAIDNKTSAHALVGAILRVSQLWRNPSRDDDYLYADLATGLFRSPTKYIEQLCPDKLSREKVSLIRLLKSQQFVDRFYAESGPQPPGAIGLPKEVADAVKEEKLAQWKQQQEFRRQEEAAAQHNRLTDELNRRNNAHSDAAHARGLHETRERFQLQHESETKALKRQQNHQAALAALKLESQRQLAQLTETSELARMAKTMQLQAAHQASQHQEALEHAKAQANQQLLAAAEAEQFSCRALERRQEIETKHNAEMGGMQVSLLEGQARIMAGAQAAAVPGVQARLEWKDAAVDAISLS
ncbi:hypothetical protein B0T18DRAFT_461622 [Schizothecium vesticola]|uniref:Ankyrin n=1 Tax=Schizothecium vesticola TaxID=314040 RepID=A0AA40K8F6_9PEZI|nr:hypothetical protein B0T18DRAFT_461622 [Schizothecium vesticola]